MFKIGAVLEGTTPSITFTLVPQTGSPVSSKNIIMAARKKATKKKATRKKAAKKTAKRAAKKTAKRKVTRKKKAAKKAAVDLIISKSRTKAAVTSCNVSGDFYSALDSYVREAINAAEERASANGRKTLRPQDL